MGRQHSAVLSASSVASSPNYLVNIALARYLGVAKFPAPAILPVANAIDSMMDQRLKAIEELAAMVGHDLRNPLTGIAGATYYHKMKVKPETGSRMEEMFGVIDKDIEYYNKIINDLLDYSRKIHLEFTEANLKAVIFESTALVDIPSNIQVVDLTDNDLIVKADVGKLKRVFVDIIKNPWMPWQRAESSR